MSVVEAPYLTQEDAVLAMREILGYLAELSGAIHEPPYTWGTTLGRGGCLYPVGEYVMEYIEQRAGSV